MEANMIEINPHRRLARIFAFFCFVVSVFLACISIFFILAAANMDLTQMPGLEGVTNARMTVMTASVWAIWIFMFALLGWRIQNVFGQDRRTEKPVARAAVGCLRLGTLGCALWALPTTLGILFTGHVLATGEPA